MYIDTHKKILRTIFHSGITLNFISFLPFEMCLRLFVKKKPPPKKKTGDGGRGIKKWIWVNSSLYCIICAFKGCDQSLEEFMLKLISSETSKPKNCFRKAINYIT